VQGKRVEVKMNGYEITAYLVAALVGGAIAGHIAGLIGIFGVFAGVAAIGFAEMLVVLSRVEH
jgi:hypothetical protein